MRLALSLVVLLAIPALLTPPASAGLPQCEADLVACVNDPCVISTPVCNDLNCVENFVCTACPIPGTAGDTVCNAQVIPDPSFYSYGLFNETVGASLCDYYGDCSTAVGPYTVDLTKPIQLPEGVCFAYNPTALTNLCVERDAGSTNVPTPVVGTQPQTLIVPLPAVGVTPTPVCVVGPVCEYVPVPNVGTTGLPVTAPVPTAGIGSTTLDVPGGYVELTVLCGDVGGLCRVSL